MVPDRLYLVQITQVPIDSLGAVITVCNAIVQGDRNRVHHEMVVTPGQIYPSDMLPRKVRKNLTSEQANQFVAELAQAGAMASVVEQK